MTAVDAVTRAVQAVVADGDQELEDGVAVGAGEGPGDRELADQVAAAVARAGLPVTLVEGALDASAFVDALLYTGCAAGLQAVDGEVRGFWPDGRAIDIEATPSGAWDFELSFPPETMIRSVAADTLG